MKTKFIDINNSLPKKEGYYKVVLENGLIQEKPFRIRPHKSIKGFMTEMAVTHWAELDTETEIKFHSYFCSGGIATPVNPFVKPTYAPVGENFYQGTDSQIQYNDQLFKAIKKHSYFEQWLSLQPSVACSIDLNGMYPVSLIDNKETSKMKTKLIIKDPTEPFTTDFEYKGEKLYVKDQETRRCFLTKIQTKLLRDFLNQLEL